MEYKVKKVADLKPGDKIFPNQTVRSAEWFPGGWRSRAGWHIGVGEAPNEEYYHPHSAECLAPVE